MLFIPSKVRAEDVKAHPLLDEIRFAITKMDAEEKQITINPAISYEQEKVAIVDNNFERFSLTKKDIPSPIQQWRLPQQKVNLREIETSI